MVPFSSFRLTGQIPASIGLLNDLLRLDLNENRLTGTLPTQLGFLQNLEFFNVGFNPSIEGPVPAEYSNLMNLRAFYIVGTAVNGVVPNSICSTNAFIEISCSDTIECTCCVCFDQDEEEEG